MNAASQVTVGHTVDWDFAATVGSKLVRPAPPVTEYTRRQAVDQLATSAREAEGPVRDVTGLNEGAAVTTWLANSGSNQRWRVTDVTDRS
jgi:uncharacterized protein (DUF2342 family)